jgi:uncharacterized protein
METTEATPVPLTDAELDKLSQGLRDFGGKRAMNLEALDGFLAALVSGHVMRIYRYFEPQRSTHATDDNTTYRRVAPKVGRNDRCPCGSGKKFKQCCGAITLH